MWTEFEFYKIDNKSNQNILIAKLSNLGFDSFNESEVTQLKAYILTKNVTESFLEDLRIKKTFYKFKFSSLKDKNWNHLWESNFKPILIQDKCFVRAPFHQKIDEKIDVVINPKMAFGTGHHETTRMMVAELLNLNFVPNKILDVGCGTGILSIVSEKIWNNDVVACDIDDWSIKNTNENIGLNNCSKIKLIHGNIDSCNKYAKYDLILANINTNVLIEEFDSYLKLLDLNGVLILSGFLELDYIKIIDKARKSGLSLISKKVENKWNCIALKKYIIFLLLFSVNLFAQIEICFPFSFKKIKYIEGKENKKIVKQFLKNWKSNSFNKNDKDIIIHYVSSFENRSFSQEYYINFSFCNYLVVNNSKKIIKLA